MESLGHASVSLGKAQEDYQTANTEHKTARVQNAGLERLSEGCDLDKHFLQ